MKRVMEIGLMIASAMGFFGIIYPELCLIEETCIIVEAEDCQDSEEDTNSSDRCGEDPLRADPFRAISSLPSEKIRVKSRLLEYLRE